MTQRPTYNFKKDRERCWLWFELDQGILKSKWMAAWRYPSKPQRILRFSAERWYIISQRHIACKPRHSMPEQNIASPWTWAGRTLRAWRRWTQTPCPWYPPWWPGRSRPSWHSPLSRPSLASWRSLQNWPRHGKNTKYMYNAATYVCIYIQEMWHHTFFLLVQFKAVMTAKFYPVKFSRTNYSTSTLSWSVKKRWITWPSYVQSSHGTHFNWLCVKMCLLHLKLGVMDTNS